MKLIDKNGHIVRKGERVTTTVQGIEATYRVVALRYRKGEIVLNPGRWVKPASEVVRIQE